MKSMFAPVKDKPAVERLEPLSDVSPGLLLQSSPSGMLFENHKNKMFCFLISNSYKKSYLKG